MVDTSSTRVLISYFQDRHREILGNPYLVAWGKDTQIAKQLMTTYSLETCKRMIDKFFGRLLSDQFLQQTGATIGIFKTQIPKLLLDINAETTESTKGKW